MVSSSNCKPKLIRNEDWKTIKFKNKKASWIKRSKLIDYLYSQYPDAIDRLRFHTSFSPKKQVLCLPLDARRDLALWQSRANKRQLRKLSEFVITYRQVLPTIVRTHTVWCITGLMSTEIPWRPSPSPPYPSLTIPTCYVRKFSMFTVVSTTVKHAQVPVLYNTAYNT